MQNKKKLWKLVFLGLMAYASTSWAEERIERLAPGTMALVKDDKTGKSYLLRCEMQGKAKAIPGVKNVVVIDHPHGKLGVYNPDNGALFHCRRKVEPRQFVGKKGWGDELAKMMTLLAPTFKTRSPDYSAYLETCPNVGIPCAGNAGIVRETPLPQKQDRKHCEDCTEENYYSRNYDRVPGR